MRIHGPFTRFIFSLLIMFQLCSISLFAAIITNHLVSHIQETHIKDIHLTFREYSHLFDRKLSRFEQQINHIAESDVFKGLVLDNNDTETAGFLHSREMDGEGVFYYFFRPDSTEVLSSKPEAVLPLAGLNPLLESFPVQRISFRLSKDRTPYISLIREIPHERHIAGYAGLLYRPQEDRMLVDASRLSESASLYMSSGSNLYQIFGTDTMPFPPLFAPINPHDFEFLRSVRGHHVFVRLPRFSNLYLRYSLEGMNEERLKVISILGFAALIIFFLTLIVSTIITRLVASPLLELSRQARRMVHEGNDRTLTLGRIRYSELEEMAGAFNELIRERTQAEENIKMINAELEKRVRLRTKELERAKEIAEQASGLKSQFVANVSHEIRTPLNAIIGFCEILHKDNSYTREYVPLILKESEILLDLINDLLDLAKIESGTLVLKKEPFSIRRISDYLLSVYAPRTGVLLDCSIDERVPETLVGDELRLNQILQNLLSNAVKFTHEGSINFTVSLEKKTSRGCSVRFEITDTGIGIPKEKQDIIFHSFAQADGSQSRLYGGTGLGTTIAKNLVEMMGGTLSLESSLGAGTRFWFTCRFGVDEGSGYAPLESQTAAPEAAGSGARILVAEDYKTNQLVAGHHLRSAGYHVTMAANGREAVDLCTNNPFDIILMDLQMPVMDGFAAASQIRLNPGPNSSTIILAMTANAYSSAREACREAGMDGIITKPLRRDNFLSQIARWLGEKHVSQGSFLYKEDPQIPVDTAAGSSEFGDEETFTAIAKEFLSDAVLEIGKICTHMKDRDAEAIRLDAHKMKGGAYNIFAQGLGNAAKVLETAAKDRDWPRMETCITVLSEEAARCREWIADIQKEKNLL